MTRNFTNVELWIIVIWITNSFADLVDSPVIVRNILKVLRVDRFQLSSWRRFQNQWSNEKLRKSIETCCKLIRRNVKIKVSVGITSLGQIF